MLRKLAIVFAIIPALLASGCATCCAPYDCHYPYCGGRWVRNIPDSGRVGSVFEPAGSRVDEGQVAEQRAQPMETNLGPAGMRGLPPASGETYLPLEE